MTERRGDFERLLGLCGEGIDVIHQQPSEARRIYAHHTGEDLTNPMVGAIFDATVQLLRPRLHHEPCVLRQPAQWLTRTGQVGTVPGPDSYWSNALAVR